MTTTPETIQEAKTALKQGWKQGMECPCCRQFVKLYKRKLNSSMAQALILIYRHFEANGDDKWLHVPSYLGRVVTGATVRGGDWSKLRYWGLIVAPLDAEREDGSKRSGLYKITEKGRQFVQGLTKVKSHIYLYNQELYSDATAGEAATMIDIRGALGKKFNYNDLMLPIG